MRTLKNSWVGFTGAVTLTGLAVCAIYACVSAWGQSATGLSIAKSGTNSVALTVTNGTGSGEYQIYFTEFLETNRISWNLFTNGGIGQTNFSASMQDYEQGFFKAVSNASFVPPTITIVIQTPTNGSLVY